MKMNSLTLRILVCIALLMQSMPVPARQDLQDQLDAFFADHLERIAAPGFSVVVADRDGVVFSKGYGVVRAGEMEPVTEDTVIAIGSLTKSFTALAILQLEERGLLSIDDPVIKYLPWFRSSDKTQSDKITLRMCLNNSTGLSPSFLSLTSNQSRSADALEQGVRALSSYRMTRKPGESFEYLNEGWNVLGMIIEAVTDQAYEDYLADSVLAPLGMNLTSAKRATLESWPVATGHYSGIEPVPADFLHIQGSLPAGSGLYASAENLGHYLAALLNGGVYGERRVISAESIRKMWEPAMTIRVLPYEMGGTGEAASYAMGWITMTVDGHEYVGHGGEFRTMSTMALLDPESGTAVAVLYNTGQLNGYTSETSHYATLNALRIAAGLPLSEYGIPRESDPTINEFKPTDSLESHAGTYLSDSGRKIKVTAGGSEGLQAVLSESIYTSEHDVDFVNSTNFVLRNIADHSSGHFTTDAEGNVSAMTVGGDVFRKKKVRRTTGIREHRSESSPFSFELPGHWTVQWTESGFVANSGNASAMTADISVQDSDDWLSGLNARYPDQDLVVLNNLRNGRFCQSVVHDVDRDDGTTQALSFHCMERNKALVASVEAPPGHLTHVVVETVNLFLDTLEF